MFLCIVLPYNKLHNKAGWGNLYYLFIFLVVYKFNLKSNVAERFLYFESVAFITLCVTVLNSPEIFKIVQRKTQTDNY